MMNTRNPNVERRIASLPITQSDRELALQWVNTGDDLARLIQALLQLFASTPILKHTH